jgi:tetratricopeptide (TPR) repeat protein
MRRSLILSIALAVLGGCSCEGKPGPAAAAKGTGPSVTQQPPAPPPHAPQAPPPPPPVPERAMQLHAEGRLRGEAGRFEEALKSFEQAQEAAPSWLLPLYDTGFTYLLMGDDARALEVYERLDALAPQGFSEGKQMLDSLRREKKGRVPKGTLREYLEVQRLRDFQEVQRRLEALTKKAPDFPLAWKELAMSSEAVEEGLKLVEKALALEPDIMTRGELLVHKATLLRRRGEDEAARKQLQALIDDPATPPDILTLAREQASITLPP